VPPPEDAGARAAGFDPDAALAWLRGAWSAESSTRWTPANPAAGQCSATALLLHRLHGLQLLKTRLPEGWHFYNARNGMRLDLTADQFSAPVLYDDLPATAAEALADTSEAQVAALTRRYQRQKAA
jgi:hypothetical protein